MKEEIIIQKRIMFVYSDYWRTWSRLLGWYNGAYVEVNLTPVNSYHPRSWKIDVEPIRIRIHRTEGGKLSYTIPEEVIEKMEEHLGHDLTDRLLTEDFLSHVDYKKYLQCNNGGARFEDIKK